MAWGDNDVCEPDVARARGYPCCRVGLTSDGDVLHSLSHFPMGYLPRWEDGELYVMETRDSGPLEGEREEQHWFLVAGHVERRQPGPHHGSRDVYLRRVDGVGVTFLAHDDGLVPPDFDTLIREYLMTRELPIASSRGWGIKARRPDPLFRLRQYGQLWFDVRWPIPDGIPPRLRTITGLRTSAGWTDLAPAHDCLDHVAATDSAGALVAALNDTAARHNRWGGVVITRGGGGTPGQDGDWLAPFNHVDVIEAVRRVQATGLPVLVAVGHEADHCLVEAVADFSWATPSLLASALEAWRSYLLRELASPPDAMTPAVYSAGRAVRQDFDDAWLRTRGDRQETRFMFPKRSWRQM